MRPMTAPVVFLIACGDPTYDLEVRLDPEVVAVGAEVEVVLRGTIEAPSDASAYLSVFAESAGGELDHPDVVFTTVSGLPSGAADALQGYPSGINESQPILFSLHDRPEEVTAKWRLLCGTAGEWSVHGSVRLEAADGAPLSSGLGDLRPATLTCE